MKLIFNFSLIFSILIWAGCGKQASEPQDETSSKSETQEESAKTPEEKKYLEVAKKFAETIAAQKYSEAYSQFSRHAKARMSLNQFIPADDDALFAQQEKSPLLDVMEEKFVELMKKVEEEHGKPKSLKGVDIFSTDRAVLARQSKEELAAVDSMFAIGAMPDSIPFEIRRASIRGHIGTELSEEQLTKTAQESGIALDELKKDENFQPYFTIKLVLVEEDGNVQVGYFEFLPASMLD